MKNLRNFVNNVSGTRRVFSQEDIGNMTRDEFDRNEVAIYDQWSRIGIPSNGDLAFSNDVVYVAEYLRSDGTKVSAHYRSKPDKGISPTSESFAPTEKSNPFIFRDDSLNKKLEEIFKKNNEAVPMNFRGDVPNIEMNAFGGELFNGEGNIFSKLFKILVEVPQLLIDDLKGKTFEQVEDIMNNNTILMSEALEINKGLDSLINRAAFLMPEASSLWNIASKGFDVNTKYINQNGQIFNNVKDLNIENNLKAKIIDKLQSQFGLDNTKGILFHEDSSLSKKIENSKVLNNFVMNNYSKLSEGKCVSGSIPFNISTPDLYNALGKVDIIKAQRDDNGYINILILDTYDFNKNSSNLLVRFARKVQDAGLLVPYYSIIKVRKKWY
ncbi:MAG: hypothetical protein E7Z87_06245 [Cyanobacteria bacterium SIG26]|nr:hypothetical protein [Cyanobacteria bacterium SIG26]